MKSILLVSVVRDMDMMAGVSHPLAQLSPWKAFTAPLGLGIIAALTPAQYDVMIWDEAVQDLIGEHTNLGKRFDLVGISAYWKNIPRAMELAQMFRRRGIPVVIGGPGVTAMPKTCRGHFDVLFLGEAEETWPKFLADWEAGAQASEYAPVRFPDLSLSPKPRWDGIAHLLPTSYKYGAVQAHRGCPYECEFCVIWSQFGRKVRSKPVQQVLEEVSECARLGMQGVQFADDNFYGNPKHARELVRGLAALNRALDSPLSFATELSINISCDDKFLRNLADAGFACVFLGIESPSIESLKETRKHQNLHGNLAAQCLKIAAYGVPVQAAMIIGFDSDAKDIFERHFDFVQAACIPYPRFNLLNALFGTDLRKRLLREGRVLDLDASFAGLSSHIHKSAYVSNILYKQMSRSEIYAGLLWLLDRVWDWQNAEARICGFIDHVKRLPEHKPNPQAQRFATSLREALPRIPGTNAEVIERVFAHAERATPGLMPTVAMQLHLMCQESARMELTRAALRKQIEVERNVEERNTYVVEHEDPGPLAVLAAAADSGKSGQASC